VFSDSKEPPPTDEPEQAPEAAPVKSAEVQQLESEISASSYAMLACDYEPRDVRVHLRGNNQNLGEVAPRRFLQVIAGEDQRPIEQGSGRLRVAEWLASERNPLTARVMVNRIWQHHFGHGLVRTPDNFGATGDAPTHAELLDFL